MKAFAIQRPATAFSISPGKKKRPREKRIDHLKWVSTLPCVVCGIRPVQVAHIRMAYLPLGKRSTGMQEKADDSWTVPLCIPHHAEQHSMAEEAFWAIHKIDPFITALALFRASGDDDSAHSILNSVRQK